MMNGDDDPALHFMIQSSQQVWPAAELPNSAKQQETKCPEAIDQTGGLIESCIGLQLSINTL